MNNSKINNNMEITINETEKTIKLHGNVKLKELFDFLAKFGLDITEYSILATEIVYQYSPSIPVVPYYPWRDTTTPWYPTITYCIGQ
jgi:hypothetical protein